MPHTQSTAVDLVPIRGFLGIRNYLIESCRTFQLSSTLPTYRTEPFFSRTLALALPLALPSISTIISTTTSTSTYRVR